MYSYAQGYVPIEITPVASVSYVYGLEQLPGVGPAAGLFYSRKGPWMAHSNLRNHRKLRKLTAKLKISRPHAVGVLQHLWWAVDEYQASDPTGVLHEWDIDDIAADCEWPIEDAERLVSAMVVVGFLDLTERGEYAIHDYADWCPQYVQKRWIRRGWALDRNSGKWVFLHENADVDSHGLTMDSHGLSTVRKNALVDTKPNQTQPNKTKPDPTKAPFAYRGSMTTDVLKTDIFHASWVEWVEHRQQLRKKLTPASIKRQLAKLEAMGHARAVAALGHSIAQGWTGIFEPDAGVNSRTRNPARLEAPAGKYAGIEITE